MANLSCPKCGSECGFRITTLEGNSASTIGKLMIDNLTKIITVTCDNCNNRWDYVPTARPRNSEAG